METNKIYNRDCLEGMGTMPDNSVDYVITSPPYNLGKSFRGGELIEIYDNYDDNLSQEKYYDFLKKTMSQLIRITKYYVFFNFQILSNNKISYLRLLNDFKYNVKDIIIWHKKQWEPSIMPTCLSSAFEFIVIFGKKEDCEKRSLIRANFNNRISGQQTSNVIHGNSASVKELNAPSSSNKAIFPQYLVRHLIKKFTFENDLILDPFMGTGTTAIVCKQNNRRYLGFEIDPEYVEIANKRLTQEVLSI